MLGMFSLSAVTIGVNMGSAITIDVCEDGIVLVFRVILVVRSFDVGGSSELNRLCISPPHGLLERVLGLFHTVT